MNKINKMCIFSLTYRVVGFEIEPKSIAFGDLKVTDGKCSMDPPDKKYKPQAVSETSRSISYLWSVKSKRKKFTSFMLEIFN